MAVLNEGEGPVIRLPVIRYETCTPVATLKISSTPVVFVTALLDKLRVLLILVRPIDGLGVCMRVLVEGGQPTVTRHRLKGVVLDGERWDAYAICGLACWIYAFWWMVDGDGLDGRS